MTAREIRQAPDEGSYWQLNLLAAMVVLLVHMTITDRLEADLRTITRVLLILAIVLLPSWRRSWQLWGVVAGILVVQAALAPFDVPNHHYALTYVALLLALALSGAEAAQEGHLRAGARWLLVAIMGLAVVQKLASATFMDTSYIAYLLATGGIAPGLLAFCTSCQEAIASNVRAVDEFRPVLPGPESTSALASPFPGFASVARGFTLAILAVEAWLVSAFIAVPGRRLAHGSLLVFVVSLGVLRQEYLFIAVVSLLGLLSAGRDLVWERRGYALLVAVFSAGAIS